MATGNNNKDVKFSLSIETLGEEGVKSLQASIQKLANEGGAAAPEFQALANEIGRLGDQGNVLSTFKALSEETDLLSQRQQEATQRAQVLGTALTEQRAAVDAARASQRAATDELLQGQTANVQAANAIRALKAEYDNAQKQSAGYRTELQVLTKELHDSKVSLVGLRAAQQESTAEATAAAAALGKVQTAYDKAEKQANALALSLDKQTQAVQGAAVAAEALGVSTTDIATAEASLITALNGAATAAARRKAEVDEMAESDRLLAIEERTMIRLLEEGRLELQAMTLAQVDANAAIRAYEAAKASATASRGGRTWQQEADDIVNAAEAVQRLARQTEIASAAARELAAQAAFEKTAADSQKLIQAASYVRFWETSLQEAETQARQTAEAAVAAANKIEEAFSTAGVRSIRSLQTELLQTRTAMETLRTQAASTGSTLGGAFAAGEAKVKTLELQIRELNGTLTTGDRLAALFKNSLGQIAAGNVIADAVGFLVNKVKELAVAFVTTIAEQERFVRALDAIYKSSTTTAAQMDFLRATAYDAGVAVGGIQQAFIKFSASTASANIPLQQSNELFAALVKAGGTLGLTSDDVSGSLEALSQMAGKGTVSMEELRQQLGDRLPGALSLVAKGLGLTDGALVKLVESGGLAARDLFPALTGALATMQGEVSGLTPAYANLQNVLTQAAQQAGDSGWTQILVAGLNALKVALGLVILPLTAFGEVVFGLAKSAGILAGAIVTMTSPIDALRRVVDDAASRQTKLTDAFDGNTSAANANTAASGNQANAFKATALQMETLQGTTASTEIGQKALTAAITLTGQSAASAAQGYVAARAAIEENISVQQKLIESANKSADASREEGKALVALAALRGSDLASLEAAAQASALHEAALRKTLTAHQGELDLLLVEKGLLLQTAEARGLTVQQVEQETKALDIKITKSLAETERAEATLGNIKLEVAARETAVKAYQDNSGAIDKYRLAMLAAQGTAEALRQGLLAGIVTKERVRDADTEVSKAQRLYNDALQDAIGKIQGVANVEQAKNNVQSAGLGIQSQAYQQLAAAAAASGDYTQATYYAIEAKRVQIQVTELQAKARVLEAQTELDIVNAQRAELIATNSLTDAKKRELEARQLNAQAKLIEAGGSDTAVRALLAEIDGINNKAIADQRGRDQVAAGTAYTNADTSARNANAGAINAQTAALAKQKTTSDGFKSNADGSAAGTFTTTITAQNLTALMAKRDAGKLTATDIDQAKIAQTEAENNAQQLNAMSRQSPGSVSLAATAQASNWQIAARQILDSVQGMVNTSKTTAAAGATTATLASTSHIVTVNMGGKSTTVNTASATDANNLAALFKTLENASGTAS